MWRFLLAATMFVIVAEAQRSSYAPRPGSNSKLLPRYRKNETSTESSKTLGTRGGDEDESSDSSSNSSLPPELQGTLEEQSFVNRVSKWPAERQPFWFKNRYALSSMRGREIDGGNRPGAPPGAVGRRPTPEFQSPFRGRTNPRTRSNPNLARQTADAGYMFDDSIITKYNADPYAWHYKR